MKMLINFLVGMIAGAFVLIHIQRFTQAHVPALKVAQPDASLYTEEWVYTHIKRGMSIDQVVAVAGEPHRKDVRNEQQAFYYHFPIQTLIEMPRDGHSHLSGFQVVFIKDVVDTIYPTYGTSN